MLWREPGYFWLLPLLVGLAAALVYALRGRARALDRFAEESLARQLALGASPGRRRLRMALRVVALVFVAVALAGPKWGFHWEEVRREGIDLIVALDTSRSMLATDVKPNRLERAKLAVLDLLPRLHGDRIGLVAYAGTAFLESPLTLDYSAFSRSLRALKVGIIPRGGTSLSRAIETSLDAFEARQGKYEALILITDGEDHEGDALAAAEKATEHGVKIYTVGIGTPEGELVPLPGAASGYVKDRKGQVVKSRLNEDLLRDIALNTGGAYVRGLGPQLGLDEVFDQHIARMERREVDSGLERRYEERFQIPLLLALLLLLIESAIGDRRAHLEWRRRTGWARLSAWRQRLGFGSAVGLFAIAVAGAAPARAGFLKAKADPINQGVDAFEAGDYESATGKFGEALVESPDSPILQFDLATALYKQGRYQDAVKGFEKVASGGGEEWRGKANYNLGNAYFRAGAELESEQPQQALEQWAQAILAYRRSMAAGGAGEDVRFNHELVEKRIEELKERLERERQEQQDQEKQDQEQQDQEQQDQEQQDQEQQDQEKQDQEKQDQQQQDQQAGQDQEQQDQEQQGQQDQQDQQQPGQQQDEQQQQDEDESGSQQQDQQQQAQPEQENAAEQGSAGEKSPSQSPDSGASAAGREGASEQDEARRAARAVLDTARQEELGPEDVARQVDGGRIGAPAEDW